MTPRSHISSRQYADSLVVHFRRAEELRRESEQLVSFSLDSRQLCDLELLLNRAFYPLTGYLGREDYQRVLSEMRLADGTVWPMPICLDIPESLAEKLSPGSRLGLRDQEGFLLPSSRSRNVGSRTKIKRLPLFSAPGIQRSIPG